jgi:hypothetical protein
MVQPGKGLGVTGAAARDRQGENASKMATSAVGFISEGMAGSFDGTAAHFKPAQLRIKS